MADKESDAGEALAYGTIRIFTKKIDIRTIEPGHHAAEITIVATAADYRVLQALYQRLHEFNVPLHKDIQSEAIDILQQDLAKANAKIAELNAKLDGIELSYPGLLSWKNE